MVCDKTKLVGVLFEKEPDVPDLYAALKPGPEFLDRLHLRYTFPRIHPFAKLGETPGS